MVYLRCLLCRSLSKNSNHDIFYHINVTAFIDHQCCARTALFYIQSSQQPLEVGTIIIFILYVIKSNLFEFICIPVSLLQQFIYWHRSPGLWWLPSNLLLCLVLFLLILHTEPDVCKEHIWPCHFTAKSLNHYPTAFRANRSLSGWHMVFFMNWSLLSFPCLKYFLDLL